MTRFIKIAIILTVALTPAAVAAQKVKPSPTPTQVITAQFGYCGGVVDPTERAACDAANRVQSDTAMPYINGQAGVAISFNVGVSGDLTINLQNSTRTARYDLRDMVYMGNPQPSWTSTPQNLKLHFNALKAYNAKLQATCLDGICEGNYVTGMNGGAYTIDGVTYRTQWNPGSAQPYINWVEPTSPVNVHYYKDATGETWTITPIQKENGYYLAGLQGESGSGRNVVTTFGGQYNMPFSLVVIVR
jgi:hypothetical protein